MNGNEDEKKLVDFDESPCGPHCDFCGAVLNGHQCRAGGNIISCGN